ncbi:hypothetical protein ACH4YO_07970 [Streptomyces noursei]|uniref:hypothetical protein n=1 Tax=Streptomyces noursei TaxID=1971 RepID=UPI00340373C6
MSKYDDYAEWIKGRAVDAGYPVDVPRAGGGQGLAMEIGVWYTTVKRVLEGDRVPSYRYWTAWAKALRVDQEEFRQRSKDALVEAL